MSLLAGIQSDNTVKAPEADSLGGGFIVYPSGVYDAVCKMAYLQEFKSGALGVNFTFDIAGKEYKETLFLTDSKKQNFTEYNGEKKLKASYVLADALALLLGKRPIGEANTEMKLVKVYNADAKQEVPTKVEVLIDFIGQPVKLGIVQKLTFKQAKDANGKWQDTAETREENAIDRVFRSKDSKTVNEIRAQAEAADFINLWKERWDGQIKDQTKGKTPKAAGTAGAPKPGAAPKSASTLFDD